MKENRTIKILCDKPEVAQSLFNLLLSSEQDICREMKGLIARQGLGKSDPKIESPNYDKLTLEFTSKATDKGDVFVLDQDNQLVNIVSYKDLSPKEIYALIESGKVVVYQKASTEAEFDNPFGSVANIFALTEALKDLPKLLAEQESKTVTQETPSPLTVAVNE
jgi:hypothetical protein